MNSMNKISFGIFSIIILAISFFTFSGFSLNQIVKEKEKNIKHLIYLSGGNMYSYWLGFLLMDLIKYSIVIFISFIILMPFYFKFFLSFLFVFIFFCLAMSMFIYVFSFSIDKEEQAQKSYFTFIILYFLIGYIILIILILSFEKYLNKFAIFFAKYHLNPFFITVFELNPITSLCYAIYRICVSMDFIRRGHIYDIHHPSALIMIITHIIYFIVEFFIWGLLLKLCQDGCLIGLWKSFLKCCCLNKSYEFSTGVPVNDGYIIQPVLNQDNTPKENNNNPLLNLNESTIKLNTVNFKKEVGKYFLNEPLLIDNNDIENNNNYYDNKFVNEQIQKINNPQLTTRIRGLTKTFCFCCKKNLRAVNNLYLGLEPNEKFGLLGFNGSGKSTTFKCITNEIYYDSGEINLFNYDTKLNFNKIRKMIGYCPQENPLFDYLTVRETLSYYKSLKKSKESIESICDKFGIEKYIDKYCVDLSGGNKRKLTFAIALMNYPKILLLDEPSTGVDPESRRIMWKNINELSLTGNEYNMILTTHSMEEAEVLCDTVSWLKSGNFICIGNPEKLKLMYSAGYKLHIKFIDDKINEIIKNGNIEHKNLCDLKIEGANFIMYILSRNNNSNIVQNDINKLRFYIDELYNVLDLINDKCDKISIREVCKDYSFELNIHVKKEQQGQLFNQILNIKTTNDLINEININMEPLENILTKL